MVDKRSFSATLSTLVDSYVAHEREYSNSREYNEFSLRREFLDRFFEALGWDMGNSGGKPPHLRVVRLERPNEKRKKPDYILLLPSGAKMVPQFIVEAKSPSESLDTSATITQAKSYAWNTPDAPTPIALLLTLA
jgi:predicted type IV restriction endonuclease